MHLTWANSVVYIHADLWELEYFNSNYFNVRERRKRLELGKRNSLLALRGGWMWTTSVPYGVRIYFVSQATPGVNYILLG